MIKPTLEEHTIKIMNEQGVAKREGNKYINTRAQGYTGTLVFTFDKILSNSIPTHGLYKLSIVLETANGNSLPFKHKLSSDQIKPLYVYVSSRSDEAEKRTALALAHELNDQYKQFDSVFD